METQSVPVPVSEQSQVGQVRRMAIDLASRLGLNEAEVGRVAIVATEIANNLVHHTSGGQLLLRPLARPTASGVEVLALDQGCGMSSIVRCLEDGFSTAGTAGNGLGAVKRMSRVFDIYSVDGHGTVVLAQVWANRPEAEPSRWQAGIVSVPQQGEEVCGDACEVIEEGGRTVFAMADGLGHGASAAVASREAMRVVRAQAHRSPAEILEYAHAALRSTRGAAMAVATIDAGRDEVHYAGVGNIGAVVFQNDAKSRSMVSFNGTIGHQVHKIQEIVYPWSSEAMLLMYSDGIATQWLLANYPGLLRHHPGIIAGVLFRDHSRGRDDATVLAARMVQNIPDG